MAKPRTSRITKRTHSASRPSRATRHRARSVNASSTRESAGFLHAEEPQELLWDDTMEDVGVMIANGGSNVPDRSIKLPTEDPKEVVPRPQGKGKAKLVDVEEEFTFPIMQLPTEIRLEVYRACLTRPKKIMLSKVDKPVPAEEDVVEDNDDEGEFASLAEPNHSVSYPSSRTNQVTSTPASTTTYLSQNAVETYQATASEGVTSNRLRNRSLLHHRSRSLGNPNHPSSNSYIASAVPSAPEPLIVNGTGPARRTNGGWGTSTSEHVENASPKSDDPLVINILRLSKEIYKEARDVLYSENVFEIDLNTALNSLAALHQRSRRHIKHIELEIPTYTEILERFSEVVRLSLRYCTGLKTLVIRTPFTLPGADGTTATNTTVYANGFDILRWLPQQCEVVLDGCHNPEIDAVVGKHLSLAKTQDKGAYA